MRYLCEITNPRNSVGCCRACPEPEVALKADDSMGMARRGGELQNNVY